MKIGFLDGGTGQEIYTRVGKPDTPLWSLDALKNQPEVVTSVHRDFISAGCKTLTLNTYIASPTRLARYGLTDQMSTLFNAAKACLSNAIEAEGVEVEKAGCLPPLFGSYQANPPRTYDSLLEEYRTLVTLQADLDLLLIETMTNSQEAKAACTAACESGLPFVLGLRVETSGLTRSGETLAEVVDACREVQPTGLMINCSAPEDIAPALTELKQFNQPRGAYANGFVSVEPLAAGGAVAELSARTDFSPEHYAQLAQSWVEQGATLIGGCCEVGPTHMRRTSSALAKAGCTLVGLSEILQTTRPA